MYDLEILQSHQTIWITPAFEYIVVPTPPEMQPVEIPPSLTRVLDDLRTEINLLPVEYLHFELL